MALLQKHVILTKKSSHKGPHLDRHEKNHPINLDKSFWPCLVRLEVVFLTSKLLDYLIGHFDY